MSINNTVIGVSILMLLAPFSVIADVGDDLVQQQKDQLELILIDMNQTGSALYDTFTAEPQGVVESGCLGNLRSINFDVITIDPFDMWGPLYATLKDEMMNMACKAATEKMNEITKDLNAKLELPHGLGTIGISPGQGIGDGSGGVSDFNVELDSTKVATDVTSDVLGGVRVPTWSVKNNVRKLKERIKNKGTRPKNSKEIEKGLEDMLDLDKLWGGEKDD